MFKLVFPFLLLVCQLFHLFQIQICIFEMVFKSHPWWIQFWNYLNPTIQINFSSFTQFGGLSKVDIINQIMYFGVNGVTMIQGLNISVTI